jgi:hypothetical protein
MHDVCDRIGTKLQQSFERIVDNLEATSSTLALVLHDKQASNSSTDQRAAGSGGRLNKTAI